MFVLRGDGRLVLRKGHGAKGCWLCAFGSLVGLVWRSPTRAEQWLSWLRKIPSANEVARAGRRLACATVVCLGLETLGDEQPGGVESVVGMWVSP